MSVTISGLRLQKNASETQIIATWSFNSTKYPIDNYSVSWEYLVFKNNVWLKGNTDTVTSKSSSFSIPSDATQVRCKVKPVRKEVTKNKKKVRPASSWSKAKSINVTRYNIDTPSAPTVDFNATTNELKLSSSTTDILATTCRWQIYTGSTKVKELTSKVSLQQFNTTYKLTSGKTYKARCRYEYTSSTYGEWSPLTSDIVTKPTKPDINKLKITSITTHTISLSWPAVSTATSYEIQYATDPNYFDKSDSVASKQSTTTSTYIENLTGAKWYIRYRAINSAGNSDWSGTTSTIIGEPPAPPTTWTIKSIYNLDDDVTFYWVHNAKDGSKATASLVTCSYPDDDGDIQVVTFTAYPPSTDPDSDDPLSITLNIAEDFPDFIGGTIQWSVQTKGSYDEYGDPSMTREIECLTSPTVTINVTTTESSFYPIGVSITRADAGPYPALYDDISIVVVNTHDGIDQYGQDKTYYEGDVVYQRLLECDEESETDNLLITPADVSLTNGEDYRILCTTHFSQGIAVSDEYDFTVDVDDDLALEIDCSTMFDEDELVMYLYPVAYEPPEDPDDETEEPVVAEDTALTIFRINYDGTMTLLYENLSNDNYPECVDIYPSLSTAYYRVIATRLTTGQIFFTDLDPEPINNCNVVFQWDSKYTSRSIGPDDEAVSSLFATNMIKIPYNIKTTESRSKDVELVEYIGRSNPVSYYGTQQGESASWSVDIPKEDTDLLTKLRVLSAYNGDVYVREISGVGYWANVEVSISRSYNSVIIPVNFTIRRVEGDERRG